VKLFPSLLFVLCACQTDEKPSQKPVPPARADQVYADDIRKLCDSMTLSGADKLAKLERVAPHAKWLAENLSTKEAQSFLISFQQLPPGDKAGGLEAEAKRLGLPGCALAAEFK
jgi:hypothetical protein